MTIWENPTKGRACNANKSIIVYVAKCILDPHMRAKRASSLLNVNKLIALFRSLDIGIYSYPCPGVLFYGYDREGEDDSLEYRLFCKSLAEKLVEEMILLNKRGYRILGIIGIDASPTCAIGARESRDAASLKNLSGRTRGLFIEELIALIQKHNLTIPLMSWTPYVPKMSASYRQIKQVILNEIQK